MDAEVDWTVSADVETLVDAVVICVGQLRDRCTSKHPKPVKLLTCDAYTGNKPLGLFKLSARFVRVKDPDAGEMQSTSLKREPKTSELYGDLGTFRIHRSPVLGPERVSVVATFDVGALGKNGKSVPETWFGTVHLVN